MVYLVFIEDFIEGWHVLAAHHNGAPHMLIVGRQAAGQVVLPEQALKSGPLPRRGRKGIMARGAVGVEGALAMRFGRSQLVSRAAGAGIARGEQQHKETAENRRHQATGERTAGFSSSEQTIIIRGERVYVH